MNYSGLQNIYGTVYNHQGFNGTPPKFFLSEIVDQLIPFLSLLKIKAKIEKEMEKEEKKRGKVLCALRPANKVAGPAR